MTDEVTKQSEKKPVQKVGIFFEGSSEIYIKFNEHRKQNNELRHMKLIFMPMLKQQELMSVIYKVYADEGESMLTLGPHLIMICGPETSGNELQQLFKRAKTFINTYMIVGVNDLSFKIQEVSHDTCSFVLFKYIH